jgi:hypothetical protein
MPTVVSNPSRCCPTCADFPDCEVCGDGASVRTISLEIEGAPGDASYVCEECYVQGPRGRRRVMWSNIEGTYELEQDSVAKDRFMVEFSPCEEDACAEARDNAILIEDGQFGSCYLGWDPELRLHGQTEMYVRAISVRIACVENRMQISEITFHFCTCSRDNSSLQSPPDWSDWVCSCDSGPSNSTPGLICELGNQLATARPCSSERMEREIIWPAISSAGCVISIDCNDPVIGKLSAQLSC